LENSDGIASKLLCHILDFLPKMPKTPLKPLNSNALPEIGPNRPKSVEIPGKTPVHSPGKCPTFSEYSGVLELPELPKIHAEILRPSLPSGALLFAVICGGTHLLYDTTKSGNLCRSMVGWCRFTPSNPR
jgi:hypothetical protein